MRRGAALAYVGMAVVAMIAAIASSAAAEEPAGRVVAAPEGAPEPAVPFPRLQPPAVGSGANPEIARIPARIWRSMQGVSWSPGCVPRARLRYLTVNYWGFDGIRYRGELIVNRSSARLFADALSDLYGMRYPIRTMTLVDRFGKAPNGYPGASDYASMAADNTSSFNCRYAVGLEGQQRWSTHATGHSIDINPWENPDPRGRPNSWYLRNRDARHPAILGARGKATKAFTSRGWTWGGAWNSVDFQHFQRSD